MRCSKGALEPAQALIRSLVADLALADLSDTQRAYALLCADTRNFRSFFHKPPTHPVSDYYLQNSLHIYDQWQKEVKKKDQELFHKKCEKIPPPLEGMTLWSYLGLLAGQVEGNEHRDVWIESLHNFLHFLREDLPSDQQGGLESIFPQKMKRQKYRAIERDGKKIKKSKRQCILRKVPPRALPIDVLAAAEILRNLAETVLNGRPNSQLSALEALVFAWLCLAAAFSRLLTQEQTVFSAMLKAPHRLSSCTPQTPCQPSHFIRVDGPFGVTNVPISKHLYDLLKALPHEPRKKLTSKDSHLRTLFRTFRNKGVKPSIRAKTLGHITLLTFMSQPHEAIGFREKKNAAKLSPSKQSE